jgi:hypothetical protein
MAIAVNDAGDVLTDASGSWKPATRAVNDKTGETLALDGNAWKPTATSKPAAANPAWGQFDADQSQPSAPGAQDQVTADVHALGQGVVGGTGALVEGAGRIVKAHEIGSANRLTGAFDLVDAGKPAEAYKNLPDTDRMAVGSYLRSDPDARAAQRAEMQRAIAGADKPNAATSAGQGMQEWARTAMPVDPKLEGWQTGAARMVGGVLPAAGAGALGALAGGPVGGVLASAAIIGQQAYGSAYDDAIAHGATHDEANDAAGKSALGQIITTSVPIGRVLQIVPVGMREGFVQTLVNLGQHGIEMAGGNALATMAQNYVAQAYDPNRAILQNTGDAARDAFIAGLVIRGGATAVRGALAPRTPAAIADGVMKAPDIEGAITAAQGAARLPSPDTNIAALPEPGPQPASLYREAPDAIPPNARAPVLPRILDLINEDNRVASTRPDFIPPDEPQPPIPKDWGDLFGSKRVDVNDATAPVPEPSAEVTPQPESAGSIDPNTSVGAKKIASAYYHKADQVSGTLNPTFANKFLGEAESIAPQTPEGQMVTGDSAITTLVDRLQGLRDQPISLQGAQEIDEGLGNLIDREFGVKGLTKEGKNLLDLQTTFRNMIMDAKPEDVDGGMQGFEALKQGRAAWSQAMKLMDLERIQERATLTDNPATSIRSGIRVLLSNPSRIRGYSPEEVTALKDAANRGVMGSLLHVFGGRLIPMGIAAHGAATLNPVSLAIAGAAHVGTGMLRNAATNLQSGRLDNAMHVIGGGVPDAP